MNKITIVGTVHNERGRCNKAELVKILDVISPNVVFEEISEKAYREMYVENGTWKLESEAIKEYQKYHLIEHVPVDQIGVSMSLLRRYQDLHMQVERRSRLYQVLCDQDSLNWRNKGFGYLNSGEFIELNRRLDEEIENVASRIISKTPRNTFQEWRKLDHDREQDMVDSVYSYCRDNTFETGVLLCGAAHRKSIIEKIRVYEAKEPDTIQLNSSDYEDLF